MKTLLDWVAVHWVLSLVILAMVCGTVIGVAEIVSRAIAAVLMVRKEK